VGAKRGGKSCSRSFSVTTDERGALVCRDACGNPAPLDKCTSLSTPAESGQFHVGFKKSCRMDDGLKERMEQRVKGGGTKYEFIDN
jgi:hypothetical protein